MKLRPITRVLVGLACMSMMILLPLFSVFAASYIDPVNASRLSNFDLSTDQIIGLSNGYIAYMTGQNDSPTPNPVVTVVQPDGTQVYSTSLVAALGSQLTEYRTLTMYAIANGEIIVTVEGSPAGCDNWSGNLFRFMRLDAGGTIVTPFTDISTQTRAYNCYTDMAELSDGNLAFTYQILSDSHALRIFQTDGTPVTSETPIQQTGTGNDTCASYRARNTVIDSNDAGTFLITHYCDTNPNLYATLYNDNGTQITVGSDQHFSIGTHDGSAEQTVMGLTDNNYMVAYYDGSIHQFKKVTPAGVVTSAGTYSAGTYSGPDLGITFDALGDGGFAAFDSRSETDGDIETYYDIGVRFDNDGNVVDAAADLDTNYYDQCDWSLYDCVRWYATDYVFVLPITKAGYSEGILYFNGRTNELVMHSFVATPDPPTVDTPTIADVTGTTATLGGNISAVGDSNVTERGVYWSTTDGFTPPGQGTKVSESGDWGTTGAFSLAASGLPASSTVYFKAFATNDAGTAFSDQSSFVTDCIGVGSGTVNWTVAFAACPVGSKFVIPAGLDVVLDDNISLSKDLEVLGTLDATSQHKTFTLTGDAAQTLTGNPLTFYRLTLNKTNKTDTVTISGKLQVTSKLRITRGVLISASDYEDIEIETDGELQLTSDITVSGHFTNTGTLTTDGWGITFEGGKEQNLVLNVATWFDDLTVSGGTTLVETVSDDNAVVQGTFTNNGTLRKTQPISGADFYYFGLAGIFPDPSAYGLEIEITDLSGGDPLTALQVDHVTGNHSGATGSSGNGVGWGHYWTLTPTGADFTANVTLPHDVSPQANAKACRYTGSGTTWDCKQDAVDVDYVTYNTTTAFSDWAVGEQVGPTAVELHSFTASQPDGLPNLIVLGILLGAALLLLAGRKIFHTR